VERDCAKGLVWEQRELWNFWNLVLMTSETVGIFRSLWEVWLETYQAALRIERRTLDRKLWMRWLTWLNPAAQRHKSTRV
jgi:hypothetical protein